MNKLSSIDDIKKLYYMKMDDPLILEAISMLEKTEGRARHRIKELNNKNKLKKYGHF